MLCDRCKKNIASNFYKQNINGKIYEYHLCDECAKKLTNINFFLDDLLGSLISSENHMASNSSIHEERCPKCGLTLNDIIKNGKVGCNNCYIEFRENLMPIIKKLHANTKHIGSFPTSVSSNNSSKISALKAQLEIAIKNQEFELAANIRDEINALKKAGELDNG